MNFKKWAWKQNLSFRINKLKSFRPANWVELRIARLYKLTLKFITKLWIYNGYEGKFLHKIAKIVFDFS